MGITRRIARRGALAAVLTATLTAALSGCGQQGTPTASASSPSIRRSEPLAASVPATATAITASAARCATAWGTGAKSTGTQMSAADLYRVRAGRHACFDRLVFDVNGTAAVDASVRYVPGVLSDPAGRPVTVSGPAALQVVVRAPYLGAGSSGHQPYRHVPGIGARLLPAAGLGGLAVVRDVRFAGTFEGVTTVAVGVTKRLPVRVFVTRDHGVRHVVVDVARH
jgi:hypothetical protein